MTDTLDQLTDLGIRFGGGDMTGVSENRAERIRRWTTDREKCRVCGLLRINVSHEPDPDNAPEGKDYFDAIRSLLHPFEPSGEFA